jgi:hypothetical protein
MSVIFLSLLLHVITNLQRGSLWLWSCGRWIYNYLWNQCEFESRSWQGVLDTTLCEMIVAGWCFSPGSPLSSINKTDRHDITEILFKVVLSTLILTLFFYRLPDFVTSECHCTCYSCCLLFQGYLVNLLVRRWIKNYILKI